MRVEIASAHESRHRLSQHGDRQLNSALRHTIAITQIRMPSSRGHHYYEAKLEEQRPHAKQPDAGRDVLRTTSGAP